MRINSQLPLIYDSTRRFALPANGAVDNSNTAQPQKEATSGGGRPITWPESLDLARNYNATTRQTDESLGRHSRAALSAYTGHDQHIERDYLSEVFGIDTYA